MCTAYTFTTLTDSDSLLHLTGDPRHLYSLPKVHVRIMPLHVLKELRLFPAEVDVDLFFGYFELKKLRGLEQ